MALAPAASANAPRDGWGFAIADPGGQTIPTLSSFTRLGVKTYRIMAPYNAIDDPQQIQGVKDVSNAARARGVQEIVVSFNRPACPGNPGAPLSSCPSVIVRPTPQQYAAKVAPAVEQLKNYVDVWGPANEPNCGGGAWRMTFDVDPQGPSKVAGYFNALQSIRAANDPTAKLLSPDFCDSYELNSVVPWINAYKAANGGFGDAIAWHPYWGARNSTYSTTQDLISAIGAASSAPIWVTEVGGFLKHTARNIDYGEDDSYQAATTSWVVNNLALQSRIARIYYYNLKDDGNPNWDTALTNENHVLRQSWFLWCWATHGGQGIGWPPYTGIHPDCSPTWTSAGGSGGGVPLRVDVFATGVGDAIHHIFYNYPSWNPWEPMFGTAASGSNPAAVSWAANHVDVYIRGTDNNFWHKWWDGSAWHGWEWVPVGGPPGGPATGSPTVASWAPGRLDLFTVGGGGHVYHCAYASGIWYGWEDLGGVAAPGSSPAAFSWAPNHLDVYVRGTDGNLWHKWWTGSAWQGWEQVPGGPPAGQTLTGSPAVASWGPGRLDIFSTGSSGHVLHRFYDSGTWYGWDDLGGTVPSSGGIGAVSPAPGRVDAYVAGTDKQLWQSWWTGSSWSAWQVQGNGSITGSPAVASWSN